MTTTRTCTCGRPTSGLALCGRCRNTLAWAMTHVAVHHDDLALVVRKGTRYGSTGATVGAIGKTQPLVVDDRWLDRGGDGSTLQRDVRTTLVRWCRIVMGDLPQRPGPSCAGHCLHTSCAVERRDRWPADEVRSMVAYLARQERFVVVQDWAGDVLDELTTLERRLTKMIDRPADRWYAGVCTALLSPDPDQPDQREAEPVLCDAELYARADSGTITCRSCGAEHDVAARREFLLREAGAYLVTASEAAAALLAWTDLDTSETKLVDRIRKWHARGRLEAHGTTEVHGRERTLHRLDDVSALLFAETSTRHADRIDRQTRATA